MRIDKSMQRRLDAIAKIKARLVLAGITFRDIDRRYGLARCTASRTLQEPNLAGERAIAAALKTHPHLLWRERYHADGRRKDPQPMENYHRPLTRKKRQRAVEPIDPIQAAA
ncbi:helix-turn-helix domain-containing protein [Rhizobium sp. C1]|uniref:helix-turn-helix domain-containing protein n=1 Tax=Rhizobium sp. C1 TaxID=1349799 RepID=UPI001E5EA234|nr:helix-turn-helix domain-containing protein [Rhizobium sp. C1]MCD2176480.1 helix-turn-helix domain-containing protein [Rhizobium sp. C1]